MERRRTRLERALAVGLGLFLALLGLEAALRLVGWAEQAKADPPRPSSGARVVLCLGDSYTDNCGIPRDQAYPAQLQQQLDADQPGRFQVLNLGRSGQNSTHLLEALAGNLEACRPDLVVLLTGSANTFDYSGYQAFAEADSPAARWRDRLGRLRVVKLARLVFLGFQEGSSGPSPVQQPAPPPRRVSAQVRNAFKTVERGDYPAAEREFRRALAIDPKDAEAWNGLAVVCTSTGRYGEGIRASLESLRLAPGEVRYHSVLARLYGLDGQREKALECYLVGLERGSDQGDGATQKEGLADRLLSFATRDELARISGRLRAALAPRPSLHFYLASLDPGTAGQFRIADWITHDLEQILGLCRERSVPVVLMNYPNSKYIGEIWPLYGQVAQRFSVPFVDNMGSFRGLPPGEVFLPDGHCNGKGNARVASNAKAVILQVLGR